MKIIATMWVVCVGIVLMCGCIEKPTVEATPEPLEEITKDSGFVTISGMGGVYDHANDKCERIVLSGVNNKLYADYCDNVVVSGVGNEVIRVIK